MTRLLLVLVLGLGGACARLGPAPEAGGPPVAPIVTPSGTPAVTPVAAPPTSPTPLAEGATLANPAIFTPRALYAACRDRVELPEAAGECSSDADCVRAGCGSELCVSAAAAKDLVGTCELPDCLSVLDSCGCNQGLCTWTLKLPVAPKPLPVPG